MDNHEQEIMDNNYNLYIAHDGTLKRRRDAGTVLRGRRSTIGQVRKSASAKFEHAQELRNKFEQQNEGARSFSIEDDMIFYPTGGKNLPHSTSKQEIPSNKVPSRTQRQHLKVNPDPARVAANSHTHEVSHAQTPVYERPASQNTGISDFYTHYYSAPQAKTGTPNTHDVQYYQASPTEQHDAKRARPHLSTLQSSLLKGQSPAFSYSQPPAVDRTQQKNGLLQLLTKPKASQSQHDAHQMHPQSKASQAQLDAAEAADIAARLNQVNKVDQHQEPISSVGSNFENHQGPGHPTSTYHELNLGTHNPDGSHRYVDNHTYPGATVAGLTRQYSNYDSTSSHGHGSANGRRNTVGSGDSEDIPYNFRGRNYGQHQGM
jgi:hypothetical protein